ncbi:hypothetical protein RvY_14573 [Ramazzottius varieornatus]|uniref:Uncharacterized protein n=1 Tax=Ramazzottius varieornatus TaxID=947166 RepID=A0A1D1VTQ0_RAMVA|nr:hypothetical protein RvY_14573 [Ramazzottius varieornatus]
MRRHAADLISRRLVALEKFADTVAIWSGSCPQSVSLVCPNPFLPWIHLVAPLASSTGPHTTESNELFSDLRRIRPSCSRISDGKQRFLPGTIRSSSVKCATSSGASTSTQVADLRTRFLNPRLRPP